MKFMKADLLLIIRNHIKVFNMTTPSDGIKRGKANNKKAFNISAGKR